METNEDEILSLFSKMIDGELSEAEGARLDEWLSRDAEARRHYLEYAHQGAFLHSSGVPAKRDSEGKSAIETTGSKRLFARASLCLAALGVCLLFLAAGYCLRARIATPETEPVIGTIVKAAHCTWGSCTLPTREGADLAPGELELSDGNAAIQLASGTTIYLEAPSKIRFVAPMNCRVLDGRIVAKVPPEAVGFVVETESARITDLGTEFGVFVNSKNNTTVVQVFEGTVDVEKHATGEIRRLGSHQGCLVNDREFDLGASETYNAGEDPPGVLGFSPATMQITTAEGRGKDGYIGGFLSKPAGVSPLLFVKNGRTEISRKTYLAFDLNRIKGKKVKLARLQLQIMKSRRGYTTWVPDATFGVYGLTDQNLDNWEVETLEWSSAPANEPVTGKLNLSKARLLGHFEISQGRYTGLVSVEGEKLTAFLNEDADGIASFIVVRETMEIHAGGLVHAFSGKANPEGVPPTLLLELE